MQHRMITKFCWLSVDLCRESEKERERVRALLFPLQENCVGKIC